MAERGARRINTNSNARAPQASRLSAATQQQQQQQASSYSTLDDDGEDDDFDTYDRRPLTRQELSAQEEKLARARFTRFWYNRETKRRRACIAYDSMILIVLFLVVALIWAVHAIPTVPPTLLYYTGLWYLPFPFIAIFVLVVSCNKNKKIHTVALVFAVIATLIAVYLCFVIAYQLYLCITGQSAVPDCGESQFVEFLLFGITFAMLILSGYLVFLFAMMVVGISQTHSAVPPPDRGNRPAY